MDQSGEFETPVPRLDFYLTLPIDVRLLASTAAAKLNFINHCQYLLLFDRIRSDRASCEHAGVIKDKIERLRRIISKILDVDSVLSSSAVAGLTEGRRDAR